MIQMEGLSRKLSVFLLCLFVCFVFFKEGLIKKIIKITFVHTHECKVSGL